tara:strand:- start:19 stop:387 length:369 start_codon:yes stop_codon:yes gene_type:complete
MYIRFEIDKRDTRSGRPTGMFTLAYDLIEDIDTENYQRAKIKELLNYFGDKLPVPTKFAKGKNTYHKNKHGISWLKSEATEMVSKFWELKIILEEYGHHIIVTKQDYVGKIVYEDDFQVVAI